ncbi:PAS domain S-box protein, partial [Roseibium hamelinense]
SKASADNDASAGDLFERFAEISDQGILLAESHDTIFINAAFAHLLGLDLELSKPSSRYPLNTESLFEAIFQHAKTARFKSFSKLLIALQTHGKAFEETIELHNGTIIRFVGKRLRDTLYVITSSDITAQKLQKTALEKAEADNALARSALEQIETPISIKDADQKYVFANDAYRKAFRLDAETLMGKTSNELKHKHESTVSKGVDHKVLETGKARDYTEIAEDSDRNVMFFSTRKSRIATPSGENLLLCVRHDVTKLKQKESDLSKALQKAELAEQVLEQFKTPVIVRDDQYNCIFMNRAYEEFFDVNRNTIVGCDTGAFLPKELSEKMRVLDNSVFTTGTAREDENVFPRPDGSVVRTVTAKGLVIVAGHKPFVVTTVSDVTRYKMQEERLKEALEKAQLAERVLDQLSIPLHVKDEDLRSVMVNKAYSEACGRPKSKIIGQKGEHLLSSKDGGMPGYSDQDVLNHGLAQEFEATVSRADSESSPAIIRRGIARTDQNREYVVSTFTDITRLKQKETQLRDALQKAELAQQVLDRLGNPVVVKDSKLRYVMVNNAFCTMFGVARNEVAGLKPSDLVTAKEASQAEGTGLFVLSDGQTRETTSDLVAADGSHIWTQNRHSLLRAEDDDYLITVFNDVTTLREQETALKVALDKAELSEAVLDQLSNPIAVKDASLTYVMANNAFCALVGRPREAILGEPAESIFPAKVIPDLKSRDRFVLSTGKLEELDEPIPLPNGTEFASLTRKSFATTKSGEGYVVTVLNDIGVLKEREQELRAALRQAELSQLVLDTLPTPVLAKDEDLRYVMINSAFCRLFSFDKSEMLGKTIDDLSPNDRITHINEMDRKVLADGQTLRSEDTMSETSGTGLGAAIISKSLARTDNGDKYIVGVITDISDLKKREKELEDAHRVAEEQNQILTETKSQAEYDSLHDALTGLPNRRYLDQTLHEWHEGTREDELALLQIDLDRFKAINDTMGHAAGDFILQHVANVLRKSCKESDFIARIGGDEFVVLREGDIAREELEYLADQIITELNKPVAYENELCRFGASIGIDIGIASMTEHTGEVSHDPSRLMMNADIALYRAKRSGRGQFTFFSRELQKEIERTKRISDDLLDALEKNEFFPVYQPQFDAKNLELVAVEALARWRHPVLGVLDPPAFLDAARQISASDQIDQTILEKALLDLAELDLSGTFVPRIAVNVSAQRLSNPFLTNLLKKLKIPEGRLSFEVHESTVLDHASDELRDRISKISDLGIDIEIDNFGTGQSSFLGMLSTSPKRMKIARDLVKPITTSPEHRKLLQAVIDMGRAVSLEVGCEGVETIDHVHMLRDMGCDILQGYGLAKPMTRERLAEFAAQDWKIAALA